MRNQQNTTATSSSMKQATGGILFSLLFSMVCAVAVGIAYVYNYQCSFSFPFVLSFYSYCLNWRNQSEWATTKLHVFTLLLLLFWCVFRFRHWQTDEKTNIQTLTIQQIQNLNEQKQKQKAKKKKIIEKFFSRENKKKNSHNEEPNELNHVNANEEEKKIVTNSLQIHVFLIICVFLFVLLFFDLLFWMLLLLQVSVLLYVYIHLSPTLLSIDIAKHWFELVKHGLSARFIHMRDVNMFDLNNFLFSSFVKSNVFIRIFLFVLFTWLQPNWSYFHCISQQSGDLDGFFFVSSHSFICALNTAHAYLIAFCMYFFFVGLNFFHFPLSKYSSICKMVAHVPDSFTIFTPILYPFTLPHRKKNEINFEM